MYGHVIVPLDGSEYSERALVDAQRIIDPGAGRVTLVTVVLRPDAPAIPHVPKLDEASDQRATAYLDNVAERVRAAGVAHVETVVEFGEPAAVIADLAKADGVEAIVMSTHGLGASGRYALGSVAFKVLMTAPCPVLMIRIPEVTG